MAGAAFNIRRMRVTVSAEKLNQIADILEVSKIQRAAILKEGLLITAGSSSTGTAKSTGSRAGSRTQRPRK